MIRAFRHACEYHAARLGLALVSKVGPDTACRLVGAAAGLAFSLLRRRRRIAIDNILRGGVAATPREARRVARASFRHLGRVIAESFYAPALLDDPEKAAAAISLEMPASTLEVFQKPGRGVILVSGHLGSWEIGAQGLARFKPLTGVARPMDNPRIQQLLEKRQMREGFETIDKHSASPMGMVRALRRDRILALLTDQHASYGGVVVQFFGRPAATYATPAILQRLTGAPIVFGAAIRTGTLRYRFIASEPLNYPQTDDREADALRITQDLASRLEEAIRQHPGQYLWAHRRWKVKHT